VREARAMTESAQVSPDDVLAFWFSASGEPPLAKTKNWWKKDDAFDREIRERFAEALERGTRGELEEWRTTPRGRLALVVLYDQLSRNMFRGTPRSFAQDGLAREIAMQALDAGDDRVLAPVEVNFLLMPFTHAEDLELQHRGQERYRALCESLPSGDPVREWLETSMKYAGMHAAIIERFGRFPHRNAILGRPSTKEEEEFLTQPGSSF
jgi:uncharacterized protein (DUF924 family)